MLSLFSLFSIYLSSPSINYFFFFNDTATTEIYTLSLHDALPISCRRLTSGNPAGRTSASKSARWPAAPAHRWPPHGPPPAASARPAAPAARSAIAWASCRPARPGWHGTAAAAPHRPPAWRAGNPPPYL